MRTRLPLWAVALVLLPWAGLALAQGIQSGVLSNLIGPISITGNLSVSGITTLTGVLKAGSTQNGGAVVLDGGGSGTFTTYATAHCTCTSQTQALLPVACSAPSGGVVTIAGSAGETVSYTCL